MTFEEFIAHDDRTVVTLHGKPVRVIGGNIHGAWIAVGDGRYNQIPYAELELVDRESVETR